MGIFEVLVFACPAILFNFLGSHYFPMAIPILALLFLWRSASPRATPAIGIGAS